MPPSTARLVSLVLLSMMLFVGARLRAQDFRALIIGQVTDPSGAVIPNAAVTATKLDTGENFSTKTNGGGAFSLFILEPGTYNVNAEAAGFKKTLRENIRLAVAEKRTLDFKLEMGAVTQEVTVTATPTVVETATASGGTVFDPEKTQSLPLNGRQSYMLLQLAAGVMFTQTTFGATGIRDPYEPQLSVALQKQFGMTERFRMQARVEGFNVTNTPIFPGPNLNYNDKPRQGSDGIWRGFGTVPLEQQNFPRNVQVSLKLIF